MNLGEARALVRLYINEPKAAHWTDAQLNQLISLANLDVFHQIVAQTPDVYTAFNQFLVPTNTQTLDFGDQRYVYLNNTKQSACTQVLCVAASKERFVLATQANAFGAPGTNTVPLMPMTKVVDLLTHSPNPDGYSAGVNNGYPTSYKIINNRVILFAPVPQQAFYLWMWFVPMLAENGTLTSDAAPLLQAGGTEGANKWYLPYTPTPYDELVPLLAAIRAKVSVGDADDGLSALYRSRVDSMKNVLGSSLQRQTPQSIMGVQPGR